MIDGDGSHRIDSHATKSQQHTYPFDAASCWLSQDVVNGNLYLWHEKYSLRQTLVLGFVACRVTNKLCGLGPAERSWGGVKQIKDGKCSHLSEALDAKGHNDSFGDDDIKFDLELDKFGVDMIALKQVQI